MRQRDAKFVPQVSFSSIWQLPVQTALNAQKSTLPMTIDFLFAALINTVFPRFKYGVKTDDTASLSTYHRPLLRRQSGYRPVATPQSLFHYPVHGE